MQIKHVHKIHNIHRPIHRILKSYVYSLLHALKRDGNTVKTLSAPWVLGHQKEESYSTDRNGFWSSRNILISSFIRFFHFPFRIYILISILGSILIFLNERM